MPNARAVSRSGRKGRLRKRSRSEVKRGTRCRTPRATTSSGSEGPRPRSANGVGQVHWGPRDAHEHQTGSSTTSALARRRPARAVEVDADRGVRTRALPGGGARGELRHRPWTSGERIQQARTTSRRATFRRTPGVPRRTPQGGTFRGPFPPCVRSDPGRSHPVYLGARGCARQNPALISEARGRGMTASNFAGCPGNRGLVGRGPTRANAGTSGRQTVRRLRICSEFRDRRARPDRSAGARRCSTRLLKPAARRGGGDSAVHVDTSGPTRAGGWRRCTSCWSTNGAARNGLRRRAGSAVLKVQFRCPARALNATRGPVTGAQRRASG